jgi:hypothetical protein
MSSSMSAASSSQSKAQDEDFPHEVKAQMKQFQDLLSQLRVALKPLSENGAGEDRVPLASAQSDLTTCYAVNSLFWGESHARHSATPVSQIDHTRAAYLIASGQNPKEHDVKRELSRLKVSMQRLRDLTGRDSASAASRSLRLDVPAASRMVKHSLCQQQAEDQDCDEAESGRKRKKRKT